MDPSAEEWRRKVEVVAFVYLKTAIWKVANLYSLEAQTCSRQ